MDKPIVLSLMQVIAFFVLAMPSSGNAQYAFLSTRPGATGSVWSKGLYVNSDKELVRRDPASSTTEWIKVFFDVSEMGPKDRNPAGQSALSFGFNLELTGEKAQNDYARLSAAVLLKTNSKTWVKWKDMRTTASADASRWIGKVFHAQYHCLGKQADFEKLLGGWPRKGDFLITIPPGVNPRIKGGSGIAYDTHGQDGLYRPLQ